MRRIFLASTMTCLAAGIGWACTGDESSPSAPVDAGPDVSRDVQPLPDSNVPPPDGSVEHCTLGDGRDPVALCLQKHMLGSLVDHAYAKGVGVAASWDWASSTPDQDDAGKMLHDVRDDLWFTSSIASYHVSSGLYGDTTLTPALNDLLAEFEPVLEKELSPLPAGYDGETYAHLRNTAAGLRYINENTKAGAVDAIADAYGRQIYATYARALAGDSGAPDAVLGVPDGNGQFAYVVSDAVTGALALLDMASRHGGEAGDDAASAALWEKTAIAVLDHLYARARDASGLYYRALVTSADPQHDALAPSPQGDDVILADVQATVALALSRGYALVNDPQKGAALSAATRSYAFQDHSSQVLDALNGAESLWDGAEDAGADAGLPAGYVEGMVPSISSRLTNRSTRANALLLAAIHRHIVDEGGKEAWQGKWLRAELTKTSPANTSLLSVVSGQGEAQTAGWFRAASYGYGFALTLTPDGGDAGLEPRAQSFVTASIGAALEALNELYYGWK